jgi:hypothetical protein
MVLTSLAGDTVREIRQRWKRLGRLAKARELMRLKRDELRQILLKKGLDLGSSRLTKSCMVGILIGLHTDGHVDMTGL